MTEPTIQAMVESGAKYPDPSEEQLSDLAQLIFDGGEEFLVVDRTTDPEGQTYVQCAEIEDDDGMWRLVVQYRDGGPDRHYQAFVDKLDVLQAVITGWAAGRSNWRGDLEWKQVTFD